MHHKKNGRSWLTRPILIFFAGLFFLPAGVWGVSIGLEPLSLRPGESGTTNLTLDSLPSGLSGYRTGMKLTTPGIAEFTDVSFPPWAGLSDKTGFPGTDVSITAANLGGSLERDSGRTVLATLTVRGITAGSTMVIFSDLTINDNTGDVITATVQNSTLIVSPGAEGTSQVFESSGSETPPGIPSPATSLETEVITTLPTQVPETGQATGQQTSTQIPSSESAVQETGTQAIPTQQTPAPVTPARGIPLLSQAGVAGLIGAILVVGTRRKEK
jgi:hypothetical protein